MAAVEWIRYSAEHKIAPHLLPIVRRLDKEAMGAKTKDGQPILERSICGFHFDEKGRPIADVASYVEFYHGLEGGSPLKDLQLDVNRASIELDSTQAQELLDVIKNTLEKFRKEMKSKLKIAGDESIVTKELAHATTEHKILTFQPYDPEESKAYFRDHGGIRNLMYVESLLDIVKDAQDKLRRKKLN